MTNPEEPKALKALYIVGPGVCVYNKIKTLFEKRKDNCLIIGDGFISISTEYIKTTLEQHSFKITKDTRIDIDAHADRTDGGQHEIQTNTPNLEDTLSTEQLFQELRAMANCPLYVHLRSCYAGSANKAASSLGNESILITHVESKEVSNRQLDCYSIIFSLERYLNENLTAYQQFILDFPKHFETTTFNKVGAKGAIKKFKFTHICTHKEKKMADILKNLSSQKDITTYFNNFFAEEGKRFIDEFEDVDVANAIDSVSKLSKQTIKTFATGALMHLCVITTDQHFMPSLEQLVSILIKQGLDINSYINGNTLLTTLHLVCQQKPWLQGHSKVVKMLLKNGADMYAKNKCGTTPFHVACEQGNSEIVKMFLENGADIHVKDKCGATPFHYACQEGNSEVVKMLLIYKANPNIEDNYDTPLHCACNRGHSKVVKILLKNGANVNAKDNYGNTPLHCACEEGPSEVITTLMKNGANIDAKDNYGNTPFHVACKGGYTSIIEQLLAYATHNSLTIKNNDGKIPLELISADNKEAIALLTKVAESMQTEKINDSSVNPLLHDDQQSNTELTELSLVGHTEDCHLDY